MERLDAVPGIQAFESRVKGTGYEMTDASLDTMQVNVGRLCNLSCKHCHVEAGPGRREIMSSSVMEDILTVCREQQVGTIDITGGAPEMNPHFRWFVQACREICDHVIVRTNMVILTKLGYEDLPEFYADHKVNLVCSLPYYRPAETDRVRGSGTFQTSIQVLRRLNGVGYGSNPELVLDLVYNPAGAFFPPAQAGMEQEYKTKLQADFDIVFNRLFTITNNPVGRFGAFLERSGNLRGYMEKLCRYFNPATLPSMMCRFQLSVGYDGSVYDCDFNQAAGLPAAGGARISDWVGKPYRPRKICFGQHCYACTAGAGSSCGGATA